MITEGVGSHRAQYELGVLRQITLSTEPILHGIFHLIERDPLAGFDDPVGNRKRVIEDAGVGKAPHRETVEPLERARMPLALLLVFHAYFSGKHAARILIAWRTAFDGAQSKPTLPPWAVNESFPIGPRGVPPTLALGAQHVRARH